MAVLSSMTQLVTHLVRFFFLLLTASGPHDNDSKGVFIDNAQDLIKKPPLTDHDIFKRFNRTVSDAIASGLTSLHDAGFNPMSLEFFKRLQ